MTSSKRGKPGRHVPAFILLFLTRKPSYGFELLKSFESELPNNLIDSAAIYRCLKNLETKGAVVATWDTSESGAAKKIYTITEDGYKVLGEFRDDIKKRHQNLSYFLDSYDDIEKKL